MSENFNGGKAMDNRQNPDVQEQQVYGQTIQEQQIYGQPSPKLQTKHTENLKKHFGILGPACVLYSCFYALCLYKNGGGIGFRSVVIVATGHGERKRQSHQQRNEYFRKFACHFSISFLIWNTIIRYR